MSTTILTPFTVTGGHIGQTTDTFIQIEQKIHSVLTTDRYERIGIPSYGAGVNQLLFGPVDDLVSADFRMDAMTELSDRISGIIFMDLKVTAVDESQVDITVYYKLPLASVRQTTYRVAVPGNLSEETGF
jgi:phage baseplate assembly protein W